MNKKNEAIKRITLECKGKKHLIPFEEYLTSICTNDMIAEKILNPDKTLEGAFNKMKDIARTRAVNGCAFIPPEEGFAIIREYYEMDKDNGIESPKDEADIIDIMDLI